MQTRIHHPGTRHPVIPGGNARQYIFFEDADRFPFLQARLHGFPKKGWTMNIYADKTEKNELRPVGSETRQRGGGESFLAFGDNRPRAAAQRKLQETVDGSPQAKLAANMQIIAENYAAKQCVSMPAHAAQRVVQAYMPPEKIRGSDQVLNLIRVAVTNPANVDGMQLTIDQGGGIQQRITMRQGPAGSQFGIRYDTIAERTINYDITELSAMARDGSLYHAILHELAHAHFQHGQIQRGTVGGPEKEYQADLSAVLSAYMDDPFAAEICTNAFAQRIASLPDHPGTTHPYNRQRAQIIIQLRQYIENEARVNLTVRNKYTGVSVLHHNITLNNLRIHQQQPYQDITGITWTITPEQAENMHRADMTRLVDANLQAHQQVAGLPGTPGHPTIVYW